MLCTLVRCQAIVYDAGRHLNGMGAVYTMCTHFRPHEVLTRAEWILAITGVAGPALNRHWVAVSKIFSVNTPPPTESTVQCRFVDGQSRRRWTSVEPGLGWHVMFAEHSVVGDLAADMGPLCYQENTRYSHNTVLMLAHRLRRWPNIKTTLGEWPMFAGISYQPLSCERGDITSLQKRWTL